MSPTNDSDGADPGGDRGGVHPPVDHEAGDGAENDADEHRALPEQLQAVVDDAAVGECAEAELLGTGAGRGQRVVDQPGGPLRQARDHGQHDGRGVAPGADVERLRADDQADVEQHGHQGLHGEDRQERADEAGEAHDGDDDAGHQGVADPPADLLPAGVADVDRRREGRAEERADDRAESVGGQHLPGRVPVAGRGGRLHVGHALGEVVDAQRDRRGQQRRDVLAGR